MSSGRPCPLCGDPNEPTNKEDALPQWVRRFAAEQGGERFTGNAWGRPFDGVLPPAVKVTIGKRCNTWMGGEFEVPTKPFLVPLMLGVAHSLEEGEQELVARWIAKTALMTELAMGTRGRVPEHVYRRFRATGMPPPESRVLLGAYSAGGTHPVPAPEKVSLNPKESPQLAGGSWIQYSFEPVIGWLVPQFVLPLGRPLMRSRAERDGHLVPIWPPTRRVVDWPPRPMDAQTAALREMWLPQ